MTSPIHRSSPHPPSLSLAASFGPPHLTSGSSSHPPSSSRAAPFGPLHLTSGSSLSPCPPLIPLFPAAHFCEPVERDPWTTLSRLAIEQKDKHIIGILEKYRSCANPLIPAYKCHDAESWSSLCHFAHLNQLTLSTRSNPRLVGELQERWMWYSDHLPVGYQINNHRFASFNSLNKCFFYWVYNNSQGISRSSVAAKHSDSAGVTQRERDLATHVVDMFKHPTHPKKFMTLQECHSDFIRELAQILPEGYSMTTTEDEGLNKENHHAIIWDDATFTIEEYDQSFRFRKDCARPYQSFILKDKGTQEFWRVFNLHLPVDASMSAILELVAHLIDKYGIPDFPYLFFGDLNCPPKQFEELFFDALSKILNIPQHKFKTHFSVYLPPYQTNIAPNTTSTPLWSTTTDYLAVWSPYPLAVMPLNAEDVLGGLSQVANLL